MTAPRMLSEAQPVGLADSGTTDAADGSAARPTRLGQRPRRPLRRALTTTVRSPQGMVALGVVALFALAAVLAPLVAPHDPIAQDRDAVLAPPGGEYWLGTDQLGRDILSRIIFGARIALTVGIGGVLLGATVGTLLGIASAYYRGWVDSVTGRIWDALLAYPGLLLAIVVVAVLGTGTGQVLVAIALINIPVFARLARASTLRERERDYVVAAECLGGRDAHIMVKHLLPNVLGPLLVQLSLAIGMGILLEAGLSFIGLGTQPPQPSWGLMLNESRTYLRDAPWYGVFPGLTLAVFLLALNLLADSLRESLGGRKSRVW
ncbi:ABC transporter permease [Jiangella asiatica]|uniref:ABC transporter permease n=1 Tax=Jiangella asiatica TaxID=2530372 RepID=A0A4R5DBW8_9ACTN|nr:ABC transporter permease [Jiangella asiatica]TDE11206.1 ABC transporter permease [Jiangella asiatica]